MATHWLLLNVPLPQFPQLSNGHAQKKKCIRTYEGLSNTESYSSLVKDMGMWPESDQPGCFSKDTEIQMVDAPLSPGCILRGWALVSPSGSQKPHSAPRSEAIHPSCDSRSTRHLPVLSSSYP